MNTSNFQTAQVLTHISPLSGGSIQMSRIFVLIFNPTADQRLAFVLTHLTSAVSSSSASLVHTISFIFSLKYSC